MEKVKEYFSNKLDAASQEYSQKLQENIQFLLDEMLTSKAERVKKAGCDGIELHFAHGYLVGEFMSEYANKRMDEFGGSFENRMRFPLAIIKKVREKVGKDYPVIVRISVDDIRNGGVTIDEARMICREFEAAGLDGINVTVGGYWNAHYYVAPAAVPRGYLLKYAEEIKKAVNIPVIAVGRIGQPAMARDAILGGKADMIAMGRASLVDPYIPEKILEGRIDEICPCIGCLQGCTETTNDPSDPSITCTANAFLGKEKMWEIKPAEISKNVIVVGGGPGGLEAAWVMAKRGHKVTLFEKNKEVGGNFRLGAIPPTKQEIVMLIKYYETMCRKYGVDIRLNTEVSADDILNAKPDAVVIASGSTEIVPNIEGIDQEHVVMASDVLMGRKDATGKIMVLGGGMVGAETADFLSEYGNDITIVEMRDEIAKDVARWDRIYLIDRLRHPQHPEAHVHFLTNTTVKAIEGHKVIAEADGETKVLGDFDTIIVAAGYRPAAGLAEELEGKTEVHVIGDARKARKAIDAIREGAKLAISI